MELVKLIMPLLLACAAMLAVNLIANPETDKRVKPVIIVAGSLMMLFSIAVFFL